MEKDTVQSHYLYTFTQTIRETPKVASNLFCTANDFHDNKSK